MLPRLLAPASAHLLQLGSELFINEQVDEEVGQVVDVERETKVATDRFTGNEGEYEGCVRQNENEKQAQTDFHCLHVPREKTKIAIAASSAIDIGEKYATLFTSCNGGSCINLSSTFSVNTSKLSVKNSEYVDMFQK